MISKPQMVFEQKEEKSKDGKHVKTTKREVTTEDIIAIGAVIVAILVVLGMIFGKLPINEYTYGLAGMTLAGAAAAEIVKARREKATKKK